MIFLGDEYSQVTGFISQIRLISNEREEEFNQLLKELITKKSVDENFKKELSDFFLLVFESAFFVSAFADNGINSNLGFFPELAKRIKHKLLPINSQENELSHFINFAFNKQMDYVWLQKINYSSWEAIIKLVDTNQFQNHSKKLAQQIYNAIIILCHRLTTVGIDPYLVSKLPEIDDSTSPFFELNNQVSVFVKKHLDNRGLDICEDELQLVLKTINGVETIFKEIQSKKDELGTSLHLTFLLKRAQQHVDRIRLLLNLFITKQASNRVLTASCLITELVKAEQTKNNIGQFIKENTNLLAYRIISHTSKKGEHYIGFSKKENYALFKSAMGGGLVVVFLVYIKHLIHHLHVSLFFEGFLFGLNYALGFVFMHLAHLTLATKQPAMTASYIAESIGNKKEDGSNLIPWHVFKQIIRSQFISLIGNLIVVLPVCFGFCVAQV